MRPLFFDHGSDPVIWNYPLQWQLGDDLLVSPVTEPGATTWSTYLPVGEWVDVWTGQRLSGGGPVSREVPVEVVPVYCRADRWPDLATLFGDPES